MSLVYVLSLQPPVLTEDLVTKVAFHGAKLDVNVLEGKEILKSGKNRFSFIRIVTSALK